MVALVDVKTLNKMFNSHSKKKQRICFGKCYCCGCDVRITLTKTSKGYGFENGAL